MVRKPRMGPTKNVSCVCTGGQGTNSCPPINYVGLHKQMAETAAEHITYVDNFDKIHLDLSSVDI